MKKSLVAAVLFVCLILLALAGVKVLQIRTLMAAGKSFAPPPEVVATALVREENWQGTLETVGSIAAARGVNVSAELAGIIRDIRFDSGAVAKQGDVLVRLDTSTEEAQLRALQAQAELAEIEAGRLRKLRAEKTISQADLDSAEAALKQTFANADAVKAAIDKKTIRAPFNGRLGIRLVNLGEYLDTGKPIVSLQALDQVYADFSLPQQDLVHLEPGMKVRLVMDTYAERVFQGQITAINPDIDALTRSVRVRATFDNPEERLRPGMFARVEVLLPSEKKELVVPNTALLRAPYGASVFVVEPKSSPNQASGLTVRQQFVRIGRSRGDLVTVEEGLKPGERVAIGGVFKLRNGMTVTENNARVPESKEKPQPLDG